MRASILLLATLALLTAGCSAERDTTADTEGGGGGGSFSGGDGVWLLEVGVATDGGSSATCNENFSDADCPDAPDPPDPDPEWSGSADISQSPELFFVQILEGGGDESFLIVDDQVYRGQVSGDQMLFEWTHYENSDTTSNHDSGYSYSMSSDDSTTTRFEFVRNGSSLSGRRIETMASSYDAAESDEWDGGDVGFFGGQINAWGWLDGNPDNDGGQDDCSGSTCSVTITSEVAYEYALTGSLTDYDDETYDLLRTVGQDPGEDG